MTNATLTAQAPKIVVVHWERDTVVMDPSVFLHANSNVHPEMKAEVRTILRNYEPELHVCFIEFHPDDSVDYFLLDRCDAPAETIQWIDGHGAYVPKGITGKEMRDLYASCKA